jgi:hypothetical protein
MTRALTAAALLGLGWLIAALALIAGICWALNDHETPQTWGDHDDDMYREACEATA